MEAENKEKIVEMKPKNTEQTVQKQEISYDQLKEIAIQATQQVEMLRAELQRVGEERSLYRLEFLFRVIQNPSVFSTEFVGKCVLEIEQALTIRSQVEE